MHKEHLVVSIGVHHLLRIDTIVLIICKFECFEGLVLKCPFMSSKSEFWGYLKPEIGSIINLIHRGHLVVQRHFIWYVDCQNHTMSRTKQVVKLWPLVLFLTLCDLTVKVVWHKATSPPRMDGSIVFASWCQYAPYIQKAKIGCSGIVH